MVQDTGEETIEAKTVSKAVSFPNIFHQNGGHARLETISTLLLDHVTPPPSPQQLVVEAKALKSSWEEQVTYATPLELKVQDGHNGGLPRSPTLKCC